MTELSVDKYIVENGQFDLFGGDLAQALRAFKHIKHLADELEQQFDQLIAEEQKTADQASELKTFYLKLLFFGFFVYVGFNYMVQAEYSRRLSVLGQNLVREE